MNYIAVVSHKLLFYGMTSLPVQPRLKAERGESNSQRNQWVVNYSSLLHLHSLLPAAFATSQNLFVMLAEQRLLPIDRLLCNEHTHEAIHTISPISL